MTSTTDDIGDPFVPPLDAHQARMPDGEVFLWQPRPTIIVQKASGVMSRPLAECLEDFCREVLAPGVHYRVFADFEQVTSYNRDARELQTTFALEHLDALEAFHVLISSRDLALAIGAYKHEVGDQRVHTYSERASLIRSYEEAMRELLH